MRRGRSSTRVAPLGIEVRAGVHTGEVETIDGKVGGIDRGDRRPCRRVRGTVRGARLADGEDLVAGSGLAFEDAGEHELKGVPDRWRLYRVTG